jgi:hypothetical protein
MEISEEKGEELGIAQQLQNIVDSVIPMPNS